MGYSYDSMATYLNEMRDNAINSTMHLLGYGGSVDAGFSGGTPPVHVTPLGGHYEGSTMVQGGQVTDPTGTLAATIVIPPGWPFHDLPSMVDYYNNAINELFDDWWQIPMAGEFDAQVSHTREAAHLLAYVPSPEFADPKGQADPAPGAAPFTANLALSKIDLMKSYLTKFDGAAIRTFNANYAFPLPFVVANLDACACVLWAAVIGEREIWNKTRESLADIAGKGAAAMTASDGSGGDVGFLKAALNVLGCVAAVAAPFTGGASVAGAEAAATGLAVAGSVLQTTSDFIEPGPPKEVPLAGGTPIDVLNNIRGALDQLSKLITDEELGISKAMQRVDKLLEAGDSSAFNMANPDMLRDTKASDYRTADDTVVKWDTLRWIADEVMPEVTHQFKGAIAQLEDCESSDPFNRPGNIGLSSIGPYFDWHDMLASLRLALVGTKNQLDLVSERLHLVADDFQETDAEISAELEGQTNKVEQTVYGHAGKP